MDQESRPTIWAWRDACAAVGAPVVDGPDIAGVSIDTRTLERGDLFIALLGDPGPRFNTDSRTDRDGHDFVDEARRRGAVGALTHRAISSDIPQLRVADTLDGLWALGRGARRRFARSAFAITGSSGKTTVRSFLAAALGCQQTIGSLNNFWGVPLSLARTPASAPAMVIEIGTNHPGEIEPLSKLVEPTVALVLNVRPAHLQFFESIDALRREKLSIFSGIGAGGVAVRPDDLVPEPLPRGVRSMTFGQSNDADVSLREYASDTRIATYRVDGRIHRARVPGGGLHRALSLAAVVACLHASRTPIEQALELPDSIVPTGRGSRESIGGIEVIDDSYNANPTSMGAALNGLAGEPARRTYAILGEMLELGNDSAAFHRGLAVQCGPIDRVACIGAGIEPLWQALTDEQRWFRADKVADVVVDDIARELKSGDVVLIKGSNRVFWKYDFAERLREALARSSVR
ncbi:MAG TPA: UDP-N-acetylmuramoyl-tripeptide--D-alanyl-D-alanine ligase [Pseudomonadales bacterium]|nr:UDP-N-acetylmuramoyl-tripeptide--D-alanyl-D-alanine ligase [Pseudomonadales bacterium]